MTELILHGTRTTKLPHSRYRDLARPVQKKTSRRFRFRFSFAKHTSRQQLNCTLSNLSPMAGVIENSYDPSSRLPLLLEGSVVHGYGRGSRQLGFPTANLDQTSFQNILTDFDEGVYFGFAKINNNPIEEMVMSIGWNPQYGNKEKSVEIHVLKKYDRDFYGEYVRVIATGYIRSMKKFSGLDELIEAIKADIKYAETHLQEPQHAKYRDDKFLTDDVKIVNK